MLSAEQNKNIDKRLKINGHRFFVYIGTIEPRKNIDGIIKAFEKYRLSAQDRCVLVLAGKMGWKTEGIVTAAKNSAVTNDILFPGYISEEEKSFLLSNAVAFMFPSNYEGFGLPILEAMSYGCPVITAKNSSLPEVGGTEAFYVKAVADVDAMVVLMEKVAMMSHKERREKSISAKEWFDKFSWESCGKDTQRQLTEW